MKKKFWYGAALLAAAVLAWAAWFLTRPCAFGETKEGFLFVEPVVPGESISTSFRHSVMFTVVEEYLEVNDRADGLILRSTRYQSNGLGLPFLASDGDFRQEGDWFVMDHMDRPYPEISLRNGKGNYMTLTVGDKSWFMPKSAEEGAILRIYVAPRWKGYLMKKDIR